MHTRASNKANKSKACQRMADRCPSMAGSNLEDANTMQADSLQRLDEACPGGDQDPDVFATQLRHKSLLCAMRVAGLSS